MNLKKEDIEMIPRNPLKIEIGNDRMLLTLADYYSSDGIFANQEAENWLQSFQKRQSSKDDLKNFRNEIKNKIRDARLQSRTQ